MKDKGYGGAIIGDNGGPEGQLGPVFMSQEWKDNFAHAVREADRLGLENDRLYVNLSALHQQQGNGEAAVQAHGLRPRARIRSWAVVGSR